ncbi:MAG: lipoprotein [Pseudomonadota bacterium]|nr:lipoprotein [Pseudomonadota bacterium]MDO7667395.1 lipoprotein [Pseudomonadota bacterium]MDO7710889.1 lipoprotein [Pseudomonadota bacterium]
MQKMMRWKRLILVISILTVLGACGQKGELYLPEDHASMSSETE